MAKPDNGAGGAAFTDPVLDPRRGTGPRPAARPAPGCPLRAARATREKDGDPPGGGG
ncbi:hypothetical protein SAMN05443665_1001451 [Actinomadura meyerae]|jgi:hypothetical protein|uniref:Uncharacterized protein n=1 Tax=Actinomadura meyerae TaxID=240840 RepID=A0A239CIT0_9ACTN|nr:hypothetical protein [Actinomadura meyerae]SNS20040.1 hypothetical protein SAMN05443665_1001451 [Actinomadura meyerae]